MFIGALECVIYFVCINSNGHLPVYQITKDRKTKQIIILFFTIISWYNYLVMTLFLNILYKKTKQKQTITIYLSLFYYNYY